MKRWGRTTIVLGLIGALTIGCCACGSKKAQSPLDPESPTTITLWNYYNGDQQTAFDALVSEFNDTEGSEKGIIVESVSMGTIENLADSLIASSNGDVGSQKLPNLAAVYGETAYIINQKDNLVDLDQYFTEEELADYVPQFIEEGRLVDKGSLYMFPVSKSTECFAVNETDWKAFSDATGVSIDSIDSYEALTEAAEKYYQWSDALTPDVANDGKALYGRDSMANYILVGSAQLGHDMFTVTEDGVQVDLDKDTFRTLWDNYYVPYINGYFTSESNHRSEDMKTGTVLAMTGSTSGVSYLPTEVTDANDVSHEIKIAIEKPLNFKNAKEIAVQQGAGYCVLKGTEQEQYASAEFLKWFTSSERNIEFSMSSGYSAVTIDANKEDMIKKDFGDTNNNSKQENMLNALLVSADVYLNEETYTTKPFDGSKDVRTYLGNVMQDTAVADRAAVVEAMKSGQSREEAVAEYTSDAYFDAWYNTLCDNVKGMAK